MNDSDPHGRMRPYPPPPVWPWTSPSTLDHIANAFLNVQHYLLYDTHWIEPLQGPGSFSCRLLPILLTLVCCPLACHRPFVPLPGRLCQPSTLRCPPSPPLHIFASLGFLTNKPLSKCQHLVIPIPPIYPPIPHIFATIPFLFARQASLYPEQIFSLTPVYLLIVQCNWHGFDHDMRRQHMVSKKDIVLRLLSCYL